MKTYQIGNARIEILKGDIVAQRVDAIVNAANAQLQGGAGVCGAIFNAAGWENMQRACRAHGRCPTGDARVTQGFRLPAQYVIHAVGPVYQLKTWQRSEQLLASAYQRSLALAAFHGLTSIAFPSISTGIYGYPLGDAAWVAVGTVVEVLKDGGSVTLVRFVLWDDEAYDAYVQAAADLGLMLADGA